MPLEENGERVDFALSHLAGFSRSHAQALIASGSVLCNGACVKLAKLKVKAGDRIDFTEPPLSDCVIKSDIELDIVYEDDDLLVVNKPAGLVVHPAPGHYGDTLVNALLSHTFHLSSVDPLRPGIIHRLDKDTSGLILVAKNNAAHAALAEQFVPRFDENGKSLKQAQRHYLAVVFGQPPSSTGRIQQPIARHPKNRQKMCVTRSSHGKPAITNYRVLQTWSMQDLRTTPISLIDFQLETGRTHQIRVHSQFMGWPLVGDVLYGSRQSRCRGLPDLVQNFPRQALHAFVLTFNHPTTHQRMSFTANLPRDMEELQEALLTYQPPFL